MINKPLKNIFGILFEIISKLNLNLSMRPGDVSENDYYKIVYLFERLVIGDELFSAIIFNLLKTIFSRLSLILYNHNQPNALCPLNNVGVFVLLPLLYLDFFEPIYF